MRAKLLKRRLDRRLVDDGAAASPRLAAALVMEGKVFVAGRAARSAGELVREDVPVSVKDDAGWVSRGAYKLLSAVERFSLVLRGRICLDVGASTGGFTQVMLRMGASSVYAVDVGYGLLDWSLRRDSRVTLYERTNARFLTRAMFPVPAGFAACDASFISLRLLLGPMADATSEDAEAVALVKPQFEARREEVGDGGVVRDPAVHAAVLSRLLRFAAEKTVWGVRAATWSGVRGPKGNIEYLLHLRKNAPPAAVDVERLVAQSHAAFA